jgi:hypothetical protein
MKADLTINAVVWQNKGPSGSNGHLAFPLSDTSVIVCYFATDGLRIMWVNRNTATNTDIWSKQAQCSGCGQSGMIGTDNSVAAHYPAQDVIFSANFLGVRINLYKFTASTGAIASPGIMGNTFTGSDWVMHAIDYDVAGNRVVYSATKGGANVYFFTHDATTLNIIGGALYYPVQPKPARLFIKGNYLYMARANGLSAVVRKVGLPLTASGGCAGSFTLNTSVS